MSIEKGGFRLGAAIVAIAATSLASFDLATAQSTPRVTGTYPPAGSINSFVRLNQVGYLTREPKKALLMTSGPASGASFSVINAAGERVHTGRVGASIGNWSREFPNVYALNFSAVTAPGRYMIKVGGALPTVSPSFQIGSAAKLYTGLMQNALTFYQIQRDGPDVIPARIGRKASHLTDRHALIYDHPIYVAQNGQQVLQGNLVKLGGHRDVSGGWFDAGDYIKFVHNNSYATAAMLFAIQEYPDLYGSGGRVDLTGEARFGTDWLLKMWDGASRTFYYQVGIGDGNASIVADHDVWRLPEADDQLSIATSDTKNPQYFIKYRPVFRAGPAGSAISPNLAGRVAASFAQCYRVFRVSDPAYADRCLRSAQQIFDLADTSPGALLTAAPAAYYPENDWKSDLELAAAELYFAVAEGKAAGSLPSALPHSEAMFYLTKAASLAKSYITDANHGSDTLNLYDVSALAHYQLHRAIHHAGNPARLTVTQTELENDLIFQLNLGAERAANDPFGLGFTYASFDISSHTLGFATTAYLYKKLTGKTNYDEFARNQRDWMLGRNAWGTSFIIGAGTTFPKCPHHQIANLAGSLTGGSPLILGAVINGPNNSRLFTSLDRVGRACPPEEGDNFSVFTGRDTRYMDDVRTWQTSEPAVDMVALSPIVFAEQFAGMSLSTSHPRRR